MATNLPKDKKIVPIRQAAEILGVSIDTVRRWDKDGTLHSTRPNGKDRYFSVEELEKIKLAKPLTISEVSSQLKISQSTLRRLEKKGLIIPERNDNGERVYTQKSLQDFLNSQYFLRKNDVEEKILEPLKETVAAPVPPSTPETGVAEKKDVEHLAQEIEDSNKKLFALLGTNLEQHERKINSILLIRRIVMLPLLAFLIGSGLIILILSYLFIAYPIQTAKFFASTNVQPEYVAQQQDTVLAATTGPDSVPLLQAVGATILKPYAAVSLQLVKQVKPETYVQVAPKVIPVTVNNNAFTVTQNGQLAPQAPIVITNNKTSGTNLVIQDKDVIANLNADFLRSKKPGTTTGDLAYFSSPGVINGLYIPTASSSAGLSAGIITTDYLADNSVTSAKIVDGTIVAADLANGTVTSTQIASDANIPDSSLAQLTSSNKVAGSAIALATGGGLTNNSGLSLSTSCSSNQTLVWNGTSWACGTTSSGTITGVTAGNGLSGGGTSGTVSVAVLLPTSGTSSTTSSNSGLEVGSAGVSLLKGCGDSQVLTWNGTSHVWQCSNQTGGGGGGIATIQEGGSSTVTSATTINFGASDFDVTNAGAGTGTIAIDYSNSHIAQTNTDETVSGKYTFSSATPLVLSNTAPIISIGNTGTLSVTDGTNTLLSLADNGTTGILTVSGGLTVSAGSVSLPAGSISGATLANTAVTAASYGSATSVPTFTVDAQGRLTAASNTTITGLTASNLSSGDFSGVITSGTYSINVSGSAGSATSATSATNATNVGTTATSTNASYYPLFVASSSNGNQAPNLNSSFTFNPSSGVLSATTFSGALSGNATTATTLATPRTINGVSFDGSGNITVTAAAGTLSGTTLASNVVSSSLTSVGTLASGTKIDTATFTDHTLTDSGSLTLTPGGVGNVQVNPNAGGQAALMVIDNGSGDLFTASAGATPKFTVQNNGNVVGTGSLSGFTIAAGSNTISGLTATNLTAGDFSSKINSGTYSINVSGSAGSATSATTATTATNANNVNLANDTGNATDYLVFTNTATGNQPLKTNTGISVNPSTGVLSATTFSGALSGNATTATTLQTARNINGVSFDGSASITVAAAAGTLTGSSLNSSVTGSSLTSLGTLSGLTLGLGSDATGDLYYNGGSGVLTRLAVGNASQCLIGGTHPTWGSCGGSGSSSWTIDSGNGVIYPINTTLDILGGGTATNSAKFAVLNMTGSGTPTASVSSGLNGVSSYLTANGTLSTTNMQPLVLGASTTGILDFFNSTNNLTSSGALTLASTITANTTNTINGVSINAGTITGTLSGNASTATKLATARNINGVSFDGSADITVAAAAGTLTGSTLASGVTASSLTSVGSLVTGTVVGTDTFNSHAIADSGALTVSTGGTGNIILQPQGSGASGYVQVGAAGGGAGSATPDFLVLDAASGALPTAENGAMALDSTGKFNIYENGAWKILCNKTDAACGAGSGSALSAITAATGANTINNGDNAQVWNFDLTTAAKTAFTFGENSASTNGAGSQYIGSFATLANSTAAPLKVVTKGNTVLDTDTNEGLTLGANAGTGNVLVQPNAGGQAALIIADQGSGDLLTASAGATPKFTLKANGNVVGTGSLSGFTIDAGSNTLSGITASSLTAGDFSSKINSGTYSINISGSAGSATSATTATNATNVATTQTSSNATFFPLFVGSSSNGNQAASLGTGLSFNPSTNTLTTTTFSGALSGNATTATTLATPRTINGVSFDGSGNITVTAAAGTLTGSSLNSSVTGSSLTSVGTLVSGTKIDTDTFTNNTITDDGALTILSAKNSNLTLGSNSGNGNVQVNPNAGGQAALMVIDNGSGDLFTASAGATPKFTVQSNGNVVGTGSLSGFTIAAGSNTISGLTATNLTAGDFSSKINSGTYSINVSGSAGSATSATTATNANNVNLADDAVSATDFLVFSDTATGNQPLKTHTGISVNPSTGVLSATTFSGALSGNASTATKLATARNINGVSFDGSADITIAAAAGTLTGTTLASNVTGSSLTSVGSLVNGTVVGTDTFGSHTLTDSGALTLATTGDNNLTLTPGGVGTVVINPNAGGQASLIIANQGSGDLLTASAGATPKFTVKANGNVVGTGSLSGFTIDAGSNTVTGLTASSLTAGDFSSKINSGTYSINISGSAGSATSATTATNANNVNLANDTASATDYLVFTNTATGNQPLKTNTGLSVNPNTGLITATTFSGALSGNATTATTLVTPRTINGVSFDGSGNITVTADANTLTNTTLHSTVVNSSLTSVGTLVSGTKIDTDTFTNNTITDDGALTILSAKNSNLTLGSNSGVGNVQVNPNAGGQAALMVIDNGSGDLLTASAGASTKFTVSSVGDVTAGKYNGNTITTGTGTLALNAKTLNVSNSLTLAGADSKTINFGGNGLTFTTSADTSLTLPTSGTLVNTGVTSLSSLTTVGSLVTGTVVGTDTFNSHAIADSGALTITSASGSKMDIDSGGGTATLGLGDTNATTINIGNHGSTGNSIVFDKGATGNFTLESNGAALNCSTFANSGKLTTNSSGNIICGDDVSGGGSGSNFWTLDSANGVIYPINTTLDAFIGGTATTSAKFAVLNMTGSGTPTASVSSGLNGAGAYLTAKGLLATTADQVLTLGDTNTGNIQFYSGSNTLTSGGALTLAGTITANTTNTINGVSINAGTIIGTLSGNASTATTLATPRTINGVSFDGSGNITVTAAAGTLTGSSLNSSVTGSSLTSVGTLVSGTKIDTDTFTDHTLTDSGALTLATTGDNNLTLTPGGVGNVQINPNAGGAAALEVIDNGLGDLFTASAGATPKFTVKANGNVVGTGSLSGFTIDGGSNTVTGLTASSLTAGDFSSKINSGTYSINISGSAGSATTATTATNANNVNLANDTASATDYLVFTNTATGNQPLKTNTGISVNPSTGVLSATTFSGSLSGNATTATTLQNARTINGVSFDGSGNITVTAAAGTLTGSSLNSSVTGSSLTSVGTLTGLTVSGAINGTSTSSTALMVASTSTNYGLQVDESAASAVTGLKIAAAATGGTTALAALDSGTNSSLSIDAKGNGTITINGTATGLTTVGHGLTLTSGTTLTVTGDTITGAPTWGSNQAITLSTAAQPNITSVGTLTGLSTSGAVTITSSSSTALAVGLNGTTNPALQIDASTASSATGIKIKSAAAGGGIAISGISSGTNENLSLDAKGAGTITIGGISTGDVILGTTTNGLDFSLTTGPAYKGGGRPTRSINLSPEYAGAVLTAFYGAGTDTNITGNMTSDTDTTEGTSIRNYYNWVASSGTQQFYTVAVRVTLPSDFSAWATSNAVTVSYITQSATSSNSLVDVRLYNENSASVVASSTSNASTSWATASFGASSLTGWATAGQTAVIYLRMGSASSNYVRVGDIVLTYLAAY